MLSKHDTSMFLLNAKKPQAQIELERATTKVERREKQLRGIFDFYSR